MSLDVTLINKIPKKIKGTGVFIRDAGQTRELTIKEVQEKFPNSQIAEQKFKTNEVYSANITHNLGEMADKAGLYEALWRPHRLKESYNIPEEDHHAETEFEEKSITLAKDLIPFLEKGLKDLIDKPDYFEKFNSPNGWGMYKNFLPFVTKYLNACKKYPNAFVKVDR